MAKEKKAAVFSGDIIGSTGLSAQARKKLQQVLDTLFRDLNKLWPDFQVQQYRGDSIQATLTTHRAAALQIAMLIQSYLVQRGFAIRLAIGMGAISFKSKDIITSDGSAFQASGPYLDMLIKNGEAISIAGSSEAFTGEWQVHSTSLNYIVQRWTAQQAEAIYLQLQGFTQQVVARKLKIRQPSVHQRLQAAGWPVLQKILNRFESVIQND